MEVLVPSEKNKTIRRPVQRRALQLLTYFAVVGEKEGPEYIFKTSDILNSGGAQKTLVSSNVLHQAIAKLKLALKDATQPILEVVSGVGYRFRTFGARQKRTLRPRVHPRPTDHPVADPRTAGIRLPARLDDSLAGERGRFRRIATATTGEVAAGPIPIYVVVKEGS